MNKRTVRYILSLAPGSRASCGGNCALWWVKLIPSLYPCDHGISKLEEVTIYLAELCPHLLGQFKVTLLDSGGLLWEGHRLEEWDQLLLPEDAVVFLLQVYKRVACFAVPDVRQTSLNTQAQMISNNLCVQSKGNSV